MDQGIELSEVPQSKGLDPASMSSRVEPAASSLSSPPPQRKDIGAAQDTRNAEDDPSTMVEEGNTVSTIPENTLTTGQHGNASNSVAEDNNSLKLHDTAMVCPFESRLIDTW